MAERLTLPQLINYVNMITINEKPITKTTNYNYCALKFGESKTIYDFSKKIKDIFEPFVNKIIRHSSLEGKESLLYSVYFCLSPSFRIKGENKQKIIVKSVRTKIIDYINSTLYFNSLGYKNYFWKKKDLKKSFESDKDVDIDNNMRLQFLADFFFINIFVVNLSKNNIYCVYTGENYNKYKNSIFVSQYENNFEILSFDGSYIWTFNNKLLQKLVGINYQYIIPLDVNKSKKCTKKKFERQSVDNIDNIDNKNNNRSSELSEDILSEKNKFQEIFLSDFDNDYSDKKKTKIPENKGNEIYSDDNIFQPAQSESYNLDISSIKNTTKIGIIRQIAIDNGIDVTNGKYKNGNTKYKTRKQIMDELLNI